MSKISVFKFNIGQVYDYNIINSIIGTYLNENGFSYNSNEQCYMIGEASEEQANKYVATQIIGAIHDASRSHSRIYVNPNIHPCLTYKIEENQLIIKAYTFNPFAGIKAYIHSSINTNMAGQEYYKDLKANLFTKLSQNNIQLVGTETEKIKDKSSLKLFKKMMMIVIPLIIFFVITTLIMIMSTK